MAIIILNNECINVPSGVANEIANLRLEVSRLTTSDTSLEDACEEITTLRQQLEEGKTLLREALQLVDKVAQYKADAERLDYLDSITEAYGFENEHHGNRWMIEGAYRDIRTAIDNERKFDERLAVTQAAIDSAIAGKDQP